MASTATPAQNQAWLKSHPGWKAKTAATWATNHQDQIAAAAQPKMKSSQQIQAEANATAWKSVNKMMEALPDFNAVDQPYSAQRSAVQPLVDAHRNWLLQAGDYQTKVSNGLAQLVQGTDAAADQQQAGAAGVAGAPLGATVDTNVTPAAASTPIAAAGGSTANYLQSLAGTLPDALGAASRSTINNNEQSALTDWNTAKSQISGQYGDLADKAEASLTTSYFDKFKSELAALTAAQKGDLDSSKLTEKTVNDAANLEIRRKNAATASQRVSAGTSAAAAKTTAGLVAADRKLTNSALLHAREMYQRLGGVTGTPTAASAAKQTSPNAFTVQIQEVFPAGNAINKQQKPKTVTLYGMSPEELKSKINQYIAGHPALKIPGAPDQSGYYSKGEIKKGPGYAGSTASKAAGTKDRPSETTRRLRAWRTFKAEIGQANSPLTDAQLQSLFRTQFGDPAK